MTDQKLIDDVVTAFAVRDITAPSRDDIARVLEVFETSLRRCGCDDCTTARRERIGLTEHDLTSLARVLHEVVYSPGASFDRAVPGIQEYMHACAEKVAAALPWVVPTHEVELVVTEAHTPTDDEREALIDVMVMTKLSDYAATDMSTIHQAVDAILASDVWRFRRSEVPESSAGLIAMLRAWIDGEPFEVSQERTGQPVAKVPFAQQQGYFNGYAAAVDHVAAILAAVPEPQGEPSDAQVEAALIAHLGYDPAPAGFPFKDDEKDQMRAALRAAEEAKR
ncbi:hypothetical protein [Microbacterium paraoxydans]|uniref:Uncharacterized protein n=1 Tax=Microbacterium paraoxydans TaxID=199592 RepID=A0A1H1LBI1_9MICO|nr:hypothetical protein [Microbacterium paraoxydans]SDR71843.1 hypothetical protein SAMN04489809_0063 [Microbacterium paraoxydans]